MSWRPDCIFEIHQLWQPGFSGVYSNCCCSCWFKPEIIKISQSSQMMYSNNILNFQESTTILNACTKKSWNLLKALELISIFAFLQFYPVVCRNGKVHYSACSSFCCKRTLGQAEIRLYVCISQSQRILYVSFSWTDSGSCIYCLEVWWNLNFLHNSQWITFYTQSYLVFLSLCADWLYSLIIWLIISSLFQHNLHLLFCWSFIIIIIIIPCEFFTPAFADDLSLESE